MTLGLRTRLKSGWQSSKRIAGHVRTIPDAYRSLLQTIARVRRARCCTRGSPRIYQEPKSDHRRPLASRESLPCRKRDETVHGGSHLKPVKSRNVAASVRHRLLNIANSTGEDFGLVLTRYALERSSTASANQNPVSNSFSKTQCFFRFGPPHRIDRQEI
jgi:hypothetical protein